MTTRKFVRGNAAAAAAMTGILVVAVTTAAVSADPLTIPPLPIDGTTTTSTTAAPTTTSTTVAPAPAAKARIFFSRSTPDLRPDIWSVDPTTLTAADPDGDARPVTAANSDAWDYSAQVSPDGRSLAFISARDGDDELYVLDLTSDAATPVQLTSNGAPDRTPTWSPDSESIAFVGWGAVPRGAKELPRVQIIPRTGGATRVISDPSAGHHFSPDWSPDGRRMAITVGSDTDSDLFVYDLATDKVVAQLTNGPAKEVNWQADWSPDGTRVAFTRRSLAGGGDDHDLFVIGADGAGRRALVQGPDSDAEQPAWRPDGGAIVFSGMTRKHRQLHSLVVGAAGAAGAPVRLLESSGYDTQPHWGVSAAD